MWNEQMDGIHVAFINSMCHMVKLYYIVHYMFHWIMLHVAFSTLSFHRIINDYIYITEWAWPDLGLMMSYSAKEEHGFVVAANMIY